MLKQIRILVLVISTFIIVKTTTSYADVKGEQLLRHAEIVARQTNSIEARFADTDTASPKAVLRLMKPSSVYMSIPDDKGNLNGTATIKMNVTLAPNGNKFVGSFSVEVFDLNGKSVFATSGTVAATRIEVD